MSDKTYEEILAAARAEKERLQKREVAINTEIDDIKAAAGARLSEADLAVIDDRRNEMDAVLKALGALGLETAAALDNTEKVRKLVNALRGVRRELEGDREGLLRIAEGAQKFGNTLKAISQIGSTFKSIEDKFDNLT